MWIKKISKERKRMLRTQTNNHAAKEVVVEDNLDRKTEVEAVLEVETTDANNDSRRNAMVTRVALYTKVQNTSGRTAQRIQKVLTSREVICDKYRTKEEVDSLLQEAGLAVAVDMAAVEETIFNNSLIILIRDNLNNNIPRTILMLIIRWRLVISIVVQRRLIQYHHHLNQGIKTIIINSNNSSHEAALVGEI